MSPTPTESRVAVVMVSYHTGPVLQESIGAVLRQPEVARLVAVDNGNGAEESAWLERLAGEESRLILVRGQGNVGFAAGCNLGVKKINEPLLLLLNPDCLLPEGGLARLLVETAALSPPWLLGCRLLNPDGTEQAGGRRRDLSPGSFLIEGLRLYRWLGKTAAKWRFNLHQQPLPRNTLEVAVTSGALMLMPRQAYQDLGGMDEGFFLHVEDVDFCLRFRHAGGRVYFCPRVEVRHAKSTSAVSPTLVEWHKTRSFLYYLRKHDRLDGAGPWLYALARGLLLVRLLGLRLMLGRHGPRRE